MARVPVRIVTLLVLAGLTLALTACSVDGIRDLFGGSKPEEPAFTVEEAPDGSADAPAAGAGEEPAEDAEQAVPDDGTEGSSPGTDDGSPAEDQGPTDDGIDDPTLDEYVAADTQYGTFESQTFNADGEVQVEQSGELWVDGGRFRYDLYADGQLLRTIVTPDGQDVFFVDHADQASTPAVAVVDSYLLRFRPPPTDAVEDGIDEDTGATRMRYPVQETYQVEGATNAWYIEDITFLIDGGSVSGIISRGSVPDEDGTPAPLRVVRMLFTSLKVGVPTPDGTFELAYPVAPGG